MKIKTDFHQFLYLILLAVFTAACDLYFKGGNNSFAALLAKAAVYFLLFYGFFSIANKGLSCCREHTEAFAWHRCFRFTRKNVLQLSLLFFSVYCLYLFVFYPGVTTGDTLYQIEDLVTGTAPMPYPSTYSSQTVSALMIDSNPVTTTLIFTLFYQIGLLTGAPNRGMFLYNLLQCATLSVLFAIVVCYMDQLQVPKEIALISTVFFASPIIASYAITMGKDLPFSLFYIVYYHVFVWLVLTPEVKGGSKRQWLMLLLFSILIALMNKKGAALAAASNLCLLSAIPGRKKLTAIPTALLPFLITGVIMPQLLFPAFNIIPGGRQEMLGVAFQQTSLSLIEHPERYTEDEKALFFSLLDLSQEELKDTSNPEITDPIKNRLPYDADQKAICTYLELWLSHMPREAGTYIRATLSISGGYFSPHKLFNVYQSVPYSEALKAFSHPGCTEALRDSVGSLIFWLEQIPVFSIFSQDSFYLFWVPAFSFYCFRKKKLKKRLVLLVPFGANLLFLVFAPVCVTRYGLCQLFTFPMLLAITAMPIGKEETVDSASLLQDLLQNATMLLMGKESASGQGTS